MSLASVQQPSWSRRRWWWTITLLLAAHLGLVFWLGERGPIRRRWPAQVPTLRLLPEGSAELLALDDPTLFALPHRRGFAGLAELATSAFPERPSDWSEEARWLPLPVAQLGLAFRRFAETNDFHATRLPLLVEPEGAFYEPVPQSGSPAQSSLSIEGELAGRRLLGPLDLPVWQSSDLLTNSVVQVLVNAHGRPVSVILLNLPAGSGLKKADDHALAQAWTARFEPVGTEGPQAWPAASPLARLTWGTLVFQWHTDPVPPTNAPAAR